MKLQTFSKSLAALFRLLMPRARGDFTDLALRAAQLDASEALLGGCHEFAGPWHFGAWSVQKMMDSHFLAYRLFVPALLSDEVPLEEILYQMAVRTWNASDWLDG